MSESATKTRTAKDRDQDRPRTMEEIFGPSHEEEMAKHYNHAHRAAAADFRRLTGIEASNYEAVCEWQRTHGLRGDGKIGPATLEAARAEKKPPAEAVTFGDDEGTVIEAEAPKAAESDTDAATIVAQGDTTHNRHGKAEIDGVDVNELAEFITSTLDSAGIPYIGKAALTTKLVQCRNASEAFEVLKGEVTPQALAEVGAAVAKRYALHHVHELLETAAPFLGGVSAGLKFANLSMEYIIGRANEEGRRSGQLNRYAAAWTFRFFDDSYSPEMLSPLDEQMELMNVCTRLGIEDAIKTLEQLGSGVEGVRQAAIKHYGGIANARENLALELLKQAGVK